MLLLRMSVQRADGFIIQPACLSLRIHWNATAFVPHVCSRNPQRQVNVIHHYTIYTLVGDGRCVFQMFLPGQEILAQRRVVDSNQLPVALRESQQTNPRLESVDLLVNWRWGSSHWKWVSVVVQRLGQRGEESLNCWNLMKFELVSVRPPTVH